ncbi:uncharacterized protein PHACADRAFT_207986, partial [Phanerochaete carnosa HHB-10118-sp]
MAAVLPTTLPPAAVLNSTLGALMLGAFASSALYGVLCLQTVMFCRTSFYDHRYARYTVWALWVMNTAHLAFCIHPCYWYMVSNYGRPDTIDHIIWSIPTWQILTATNDILVRGWFVYRIWILSQHNRWLAPPLAVYVVVVFVLTTVLGGETYLAQTFTAFRQTQASRAVGAIMPMVFALDVIIAFLLCFYFFRSRNNILSRRIGTYINVLIVYTINTGLLTSVLAMACTIT